MKAEELERDQDQDAAPVLEWLATNQLGAFAMGAADRVPRRKYHGLLIARTPYYEEPHHILAEVNEVLTLGDEVFELASFQYDTCVYPRGNQHLTAFHHRPEPRWVATCGKARVERRLFLHPRANAVYLQYRVEGAPKGAKLRLFPYFSCRNAHLLQEENAVLDGRVGKESNRVLLRFYREFPEIFMRLSQRGVFQAGGFWNQRVLYPEEAARGYPAAEDLFCPGAFEVAFDDQLSFGLEIGLSEELEGPVFTPLEESAPPLDSLIAQLERAADAFVIQPNTDYASVVAGYPWFGEWGRDTFIALAGLTLARGKQELAAAIFDTYGNRLVRGLVPNILAKDLETSDSYAIDASLWFIRALQQYEEQEGPGAVARWEPVVFEILHTMLQHRVPSIHVRPSGLLYASSRDRPLTWMDARVDGVAVTPRSPFAVEVNALFYNAVRYALDIAKRRKDDAFGKVWGRLAASLQSTFKEAFWLEEAGYLADAHDGSAPDASLRPNQLLALALPHRPISKECGKRILGRIRQSLLTPLGLRTLSPDDPHYRGACVGDAAARDRAYHQGTVWPWLLGPYLDAVRNVEGLARAKRECARVLEPFAVHLESACLGQISEIFDGDPPHTPRGAPAQAWSVAELLRIAKTYQPSST